MKLLNFLLCTIGGCACGFITAFYAATNDPDPSRKAAYFATFVLLGGPVGAVIGGIIAIAATKGK